MEIIKIGVMGAGAMGAGIAQVAAQAGFQVVLNDIDMSFVDRAVGRMDAFLSKSVEKGKMSEEQKIQTLGRISKSNDLSDFKDVDLAIEVIIEDLDLKKKAFAQMDSVCKPEAFFASNTSSMPITVLANATNRPERVVGMHFFNPAPIMKLVEIIRGYYTSDETVKSASEVAQKMGKTTVEVKKDSPGFIVNRLMMAQYIEAIRLLEEGVATMEDIDNAVKLGLNHPMGAFELQDFGGIDIGYFVAEYFHEEFKDIRWNPPQALKALIRAGRLGKKTGAGWFDYNK
ncbi:MAG: 3-hydroxyacyl-CoA dehydrogenase NAD-binding domain-containing protein [Bacillota bacterium]|nr:3-hydroxyacyl-CoA dehydrogenase NAD-binding domain-containing protein [Bacillota bacterium]